MSLPGGQPVPTSSALLELLTLLPLSRCPISSLTGKQETSHSCSTFRHLSDHDASDPPQGGSTSPPGQPPEHTPLPPGDQEPPIFPLLEPLQPSLSLSSSLGVQTCHLHRLTSHLLLVLPKSDFCPDKSLETAPSNNWLSRAGPSRPSPTASLLSQKLLASPPGHTTAVWPVLC